MALAQNQADAQKPPQLFSHGHLSKLSDPDVVLLWVWWADGGNHFIGTTFERGYYSVSLSGEVAKLPIPPDLPIFSRGDPVMPSPDGSLWAWYAPSYYDSSELWVGSPDQAPKYVAGNGTAIWGAAWSPDSQELLFFNTQGIWIARRPDFAPVLLMGAWNSSYWTGGGLEWVR